MSYKTFFFLLLLYMYLICITFNKAYTILLLTIAFIFHTGNLVLIPI